MSLKYRDSQGTETPVAGLNGTSGELVPSVSLYQSGYLNLVNLTPESSGVTQLDIEHPSVQYRVTFATPFPDANYVVICDSHNTNLQIEVASAGFSANGFVVTVRNLVATMRDDRGETADGFVYTLIDDYFKWQAFKLMTDTVHEADSAHIAQNTANFAPAFSEVTSYAVGDYVTYNNVLYRCTTAHTAGVWVAGHFTQVTVGGTLSAIVPSDASSTNKLVTKNDTSSTTLTSINTLASWTGDAKGVMTAFIGTSSKPSDIGTPLSSWGETMIWCIGDGIRKTLFAIDFSVTQHVIYTREYYNGSFITDWTAIKDGNLTSTVTKGSTAPITSGGVYNALKTTFGLQRVDDNTYTFDLSLLPYTNNGLCLINLLGNSMLEGSAVCSIGYYENKWRISAVNTLVDAGSVGTITASISGTTLTISNTGVCYGGSLSVRVGHLF